MANIKKSRPTGERGYKAAQAQATLDASRARTAAEAKRLRAQREAAGVKPGEGRTAVYGLEGVVNLREQYGPEIFTAAGQEIWDQAKRDYPEIVADGRIPGQDSINGHKGKFGLVEKKMIIRDGKAIYVRWSKKLQDWKVITRAEFMKK